MPGRPKGGARVSKLYKLKMQGKSVEAPKEDKVEKKVDKKEKKDKKEKSKLERVTEIFDNEDKE